LLGFDGGGDLLRIHGVPQGDHTLRLELRGADGSLHYTAAAVLRDRHLHPSRAPSALALEPWGADRPLYGGVLFHGPAFQVLQQVEGISDQGISASLTGVLASGWPEASWQTDPAALDGGLQLALLWSERVLGGHSLPTGIRQVQLWREGPSSGSLRCELTVLEVSARRARCDLLLLDAQRRPLAALRGVETHLLPSRS